MNVSGNKCHLLHDGFLFGLFFNSEDGGDMFLLEQWFPACRTHTPEGMQRTGWGYEKIILVMAEDTKRKELK
jgi:hypothetical protein